MQRFLDTAKIVPMWRSVEGSGDKKTKVTPVHTCFSLTSSSCDLNNQGYPYFIYDGLVAFEV